MDKHAEISLGQSAFAGGRSAHPLCSRYFCLHVADHSVEVRACDALLSLTASWAVGVQHDGNWEVIGTWPFSQTTPLYWELFQSELVARGVQRVSLIVAVGASVDGELGTDSKLLAVGGAELIPVAPDHTSSLEIVQSKHRRLVSIGSKALKQIQDRVSRAARRKGAFSDVVAAADFLAVQISSAERSLALAAARRNCPSRPLPGALTRCADMALDRPTTER